MTAREVGTLGDAGEVGGDAQFGTAYGRVFLTQTPAGFPVLLEVSACPAYVSPGAPEDGDTRREVLEVVAEHTYLRGVTAEDMLSGDAQPFDSEYSYHWPVDYWPPSMLRRDGSPFLRAMNATARAHIANLPAAWLDAMPTPDYPVNLEA